MQRKISLNDLLFNTLKSMSETEKLLFVKELERTLPDYMSRTAEKAKAQDDPQIVKANPKTTGSG